MTTTGEPLKCAVATPLIPLVMPGPAGQHGQPGFPGQPGRGLRGEHGALLVAYVEDPHALVHGAVVEREDVRPRQSEHGLDTIGLGHGDGGVTGVLRRLHARELTNESLGKQWSMLAGARPGADVHALALPAEEAEDLDGLRSSAEPNQCGSRVSNSAASPALSEVAPGQDQAQPPGQHVEPFVALVGLRVRAWPRAGMMIFRPAARPAGGSAAAPYAVQLRA